MFGRIRKKREKKRKKKAAQQAEQQKLKEEAAASQDPQKIGEELQTVQEQVGQADVADQPRREEQREQHKTEAYEDVTTEIPGMSDAQKRAMQESANAQIDSQVQNYARQMAGGISRSGQRGGTAYAQQADLAQKGMAAQNQFQRDLVEKDSDMAMKKLAAYMASLEGKTAEDILRRQQYFDYITGKQDKNKQDVYWQYYGNKFNKV